MVVVQQLIDWFQKNHVDESINFLTFFFSGVTCFLFFLLNFIVFSFFFSAYVRAAAEGGAAEPCGRSGGLLVGTPLQWGRRGGGGGYGGGATSTGPGMYDVKNTWVKKSYNITFTNKKSGAGSGKTGRRY